MHELYEIWRVNSHKWAVKVRGNIFYGSTRHQVEAYKWACLRPRS